MFKIKYALMDSGFSMSVNKYEINIVPSILYARSGEILSLSPPPSLVLSEF